MSDNNCTAKHYAEAMMFIVLILCATYLIRSCVKDDWFNTQSTTTQEQ